MNIKNYVRIAAAVAFAALALASCKKDKNPAGGNENKGEQQQEETVTNGLRVSATYFGDYYETGFHDYILLFQIGDVDAEGYFAKTGSELSLEILTAQGGATYFPEGVYEITNEQHKSAGIVPSVEGKDDNGNITYGDTYFYTQQDTDNYWLDPVESATLEVKVNGAQYTISVSFQSDGEKYSYLYKGSLEFEDKSVSGSEDDPTGPEGDYEYVPDYITVYNFGHEWSDDTDDWIIYLDSRRDENEWIEIEFVSTSLSDREEFPTGTFTVPAGFYDLDEIPAGTLCPYYTVGSDDETKYFGTYYVSSGTIWYAASAGTLKISKSGDNYTLELSFIDEEYDNAKVTSTYTGKITVITDYYYDGPDVALNAKKMLPAARKTAVRRTTEKRQVKSANLFAR